MMNITFSTRPTCTRQQQVGAGGRQKFNARSMYTLRQLLPYACAREPSIHTWPLAMGLGPWGSRWTWSSSAGVMGTGPKLVSGLGWVGLRSSRGGHT